MTTKKRALTAYEDFNMYGGAHCTNFKTALKALQQGRDLVVHCSAYDGQRYNTWTYRVTDLRQCGDDIIGTIVDDDTSDNIWTATKDICEYARTGRI